jgi:pSer/pThr/pTyr-binding forkhead associated (FHA) protein
VVAVQAGLVLADGHRVELGTKPLIVGRLPDSGLVLTDPNVSRYHAEIRLALDATRDLRAPEYEVCDMGSTNGTRVNGIAIAGAQVLQDGDSVTIGATTMRFERS